MFYIPRINARVWYLGIEVQGLRNVHTKSKRQYHQYVETLFSTKSKRNSEKNVALTQPGK